MNNRKIVRLYKVPSIKKEKSYKKFFFVVLQKKEEEEEKNGGLGVDLPCRLTEEQSTIWTSDASQFKAN